MIGDKEGALTLIEHFEDEEESKICINKTKFSMIKDLKALPKEHGLVTLSNDGKISLWDLASLRKYGEDINSAKAVKTVNSK